MTDVAYSAATCTACSAPLPANSRFCEQCGHEVERSCGSCQTAVSARARFCHACGQPVAVHPEAATSSPTPDAGQTQWTAPNAGERVNVDG